MDQFLLHDHENLERLNLKCIYCFLIQQKQQTILKVQLKKKERELFFPYKDIL